MLLTKNKRLTPKEEPSRNDGLKETIDIFYTTDFELFKTMSGNRHRRPKHVSDIIKSMEGIGVLMSLVIVNENMEVIDGQHRLEAAKEVGLGVYFMIIDGYGINEIQVLNLNQSNWTNGDFLIGFVNEGIESYIELNNFSEKYKKHFKLSDCISICTKTNLDSTGNSHFRSGAWKFSDWKTVEDITTKLIKISELYNGYNRSNFIKAFIAVWKKEEFNFERFIKKLGLQRTELVDCPTVSSYKVLIEDIYNYKATDKVNLRF